MSAFDDAIAAPAEKDAVAELRVLDNKKQGAESRAADEAASIVLLGRFRYNPGLGWLEWDRRRWDGGEVAADRVHETVRQFIDEVERDYRAEVAEQTATGALIVGEIEQQVPKERRTKDDGDPMKPGDVVQAFGTKKQRAAFDKAADAAQAANTQAHIWLNLLTAGHVTAVAKLCRGMDGILTSSPAPPSSTHTPTC